MSHVIILAGSAKEANAYRRDHDLPTGRAVYASSAGIITGVVPSQIHTLPGFAKRRDQHAVKAALKVARRRYRDVIEVTFDERGFLTERQLEVAHRYNALRDAGAPEDVDPIIAMAAVSFTPEDLVAEQTKPESESVEPILTVEQTEALEQTLLGTSKGDDQEPSDTSNGSAMESEGAPPRRRRSKCKDCGTLHYKGDPCPDVPPADSAFFEG